MDNLMKIKELLEQQEAQRQAQMPDAQQALADAQSTQQKAGYVDTGAKLLAALANRNRTGQAYFNRMQDLGKAPQMTDPGSIKYEGDLQGAAEKNTMSAQQKLEQLKAQMQEGLKQRMGLAGQLDNQAFQAKQAEAQQANADRAYGLQKDKLAADSKYQSEMLRLKGEALKQGKGGSLAPTRAEDAVDSAFAKEYADYLASGGSADAASKLNTLKQAKIKLENGKNLTGPVVGNLPGRSLFAPESLDLQQNVESMVQSSLKQILGGQYTEKEGAGVLQRAFNPSLDEKTNAKRLGRLINQLEDALTQKEAAIQHYRQNGTMRGFQGRTFSAGDFGNFDDQPASQSGATGSWGDEDLNSLDDAQLEQLYNQTVRKK